MKRQYILSLFSILILFSCSEVTRDVVIDPELQPYVDSFLAEASKRGMDIDLNDSGLDMIFEEDISTADYAGICRYKLGANEIAIDRERWDNSTESRKVWLVYHELGHCVLDRSHRNDRFENGMWKSLMRGDLEGDEFRIPLCYIWEREQYFNDELFDQDTPTPDWVTNTFEYSESPSKGELILELEPDTESFNKFLPEAIENFEIEFTYTRSRAGARTNLLYGDDGSLDYNYLLIDHENDDVRFGNDIMSCLIVEFQKEAENKVTLRQYNGTTTAFVNEQFLHSFPSYKDPILRIRNDGSRYISIQDFKMWKLD